VKSREPEHDHAWDTVQQRLDRELDSEKVRAALGCLTPIQRDALTLVYFGGHTHPQVATLLNLPLGTVKTRVRDALIALRKRMGTE